MARLGLKNVSPTMLTQEGSRPVLEWFKATGARHQPATDADATAGYRQLARNPDY
ncbi:hypothetical protein PUATCC27989T_03086 [Phytobacter ursingii]|nr:hypothetical protein PUATCC27989T_03086 [Phytobacter ursingii]